MKKINKKQVSVFILSLIIYCAPLARADIEEDYQRYKKTEADNEKRKEEFATGARNTAEHFLSNRMPAGALVFIHTAVHLNPDDESSQSDWTNIIRALGKNPNSFDDRVALGDQSVSKGDKHGAVVEYQAALRIRDDSEVQSKLEKAEACFAPSSDEAAVLDSVQKRFKSYEDWKRSKELAKAPTPGETTPKLSQAKPEDSSSANKLDWKNSLQSAEDQAKKDKKFVFAFLFADSSEGCRRTEQETFSDSEVVKTLNNKFVCTKLNVDSSENDKLLTDLKCNGVPGMAIFSYDGKTLAYFDGYRDSDSFQKTIGQVLDMIPQVKDGQVIRFH